MKGRHAGKKAVIIRSFDKGTPERRFPHCLVAGLDKGPRKITKKMKKSKIIERAHTKAFIKLVNMDHLIVTRYSLDINFSELSKKDFTNPEIKAKTRKEISDLFTKRFLTPGNNEQEQKAGVEFFFKKLIF